MALAEMSIMSKDGDTKLTWDRNNTHEVENARRTFNELKGKGFMAFSVTDPTPGTGSGSEQKGEVLSAFDPSAEKLVMTPPMVGG